MTLQVQNQFKLQTYSRIYLKIRKLLNIPINSFLILLKIALMTPFTLVPLTNMKLSISYPPLNEKNQLDLMVYLLRY